MRHARDRIRELTRRSRLLLPVEVIVDEVNRFLRGWAAYFRYGNSAVRFEKIMHHVWTRWRWLSPSATGVPARMDGPCWLTSPRTTLG